jgi:hypothetical protein
MKHAFRVQLALEYKAFGAFEPRQNGDSSVKRDAAAEGPALTHAEVSLANRAVAENYDHSPAFFELVHPSSGDIFNRPVHKYDIERPARRGTITVRPDNAVKPAKLLA